MIRELLSLLILICMAALASSQGYMGTVSTGTGIESPITVGSGASPQGATVGETGTLANMNGTLSLDLSDGMARHLDLNILQSGDILMGYGNMTTDTSSQRVTAAGSLTRSGMELFVTLVDVPEVYRLGFSGLGSSLAGRYNAFAANGAVWSGNVNGLSSQIQGYRPATVLGSGVNAGSMGAVAGTPAGTPLAIGVPTGVPTGVQTGTPSNSYTIGNRSFYSSSNGQTTTTTSDGVTTTTSGGTITTNSDGTTTVSYG